MRRQIPLSICFIMGIFMMVQFFIPHRASQQAYRTILDWYRIVFAFSLVLGTGSLIKMHWAKISRQKEGWGYSAFAMASLATMVLVGTITGIEKGSLFITLFEYVQVPLEATMFSLLAFFIASAAYRAFRARTFEATLLLIAAVILMLGRVPIGYFLWHRIPGLAEWILTTPNMAAKRGVVIGVGLGMISTALKIILGIERSWIGGEK
jgi:hypothetical protein